MKDLFSAVNSLALQAVGLYEQEVNAIITAKSTDEKWIERTLDGMLDFCFHAKMLLLYKQLCRYYYDLNPLATASYIMAYREMWDSDDKEIHS